MCPTLGLDPERERSGEPTASDDTMQLPRSRSRLSQVALASSGVAILLAVLVAWSLSRPFPDDVLAFVVLAWLALTVVAIGTGVVQLARPHQRWRMPALAAALGVLSLLLVGIVVANAFAPASAHIAQTRRRSTPSGSMSPSSCAQSATTRRMAASTGRCSSAWTASRCTLSGRTRTASSTSPLPQTGLARLRLEQGLRLLEAATLPNDRGTRRLLTAHTPLAGWSTGSPRAPGTCTTIGQCEPSEWPGSTRPNKHINHDAAPRRGSCARRSA